MVQQLLLQQNTEIALKYLCVHFIIRNSQLNTVFTNSAVRYYYK